MRLPTLLVPLPTSADNHQWQNARAFEETGAAHLLNQCDATPDKISTLLRELVEDIAMRDGLKNALARWHEPKAAEKIASAIIQCIGEVAVKNVKHEAARSREVSSPKQQAVVSKSVLGLWMLALLWSLEVGAWMFCLA